VRQWGDYTRHVAAGVTPSGNEWVEMHEDLRRLLDAWPTETQWGGPMGRFMVNLGDAAHYGLVEIVSNKSGATYVRFPGWDGEGAPPVEEVIRATQAAERLAEPPGFEGALAGGWIDKIAP